MQASVKGINRQQRTTQVVCHFWSLPFLYSVASRRAVLCWRELFHGLMTAPQA